MSKPVDFVCSHRVYMPLVTLSEVKVFKCTVISLGFLGPKHTSLVLIHYTVPVTRLQLVSDARR